MSDKNKVEIQNINEAIINFIRYNSNIEDSLLKYNMYNNIYTYRRFII